MRPEGESASDAGPDEGPSPSDEHVAAGGEAVARPASPVDVRDLLADRARAVVETIPQTVWAAAVAVAVVAAVVVWLLVGRDGSGSRLDPATVPQATPLAAPATSTAPAVVVVHVAGAVAEPGVYHVDAGARVADAVEAAGGPVGDADLDRLNLAAPLADGERVHVPLVGEEVPAPVNSTDGAGSGEPGPIELNTADQATLETLPGVGPTIAAAIITRRSEQPFSTVEDLLDVAGIGPTRLDQLRPLVTVGS